MVLLSFLAIAGEAVRLVRLCFSYPLLKLYVDVSCRVVIVGELILTGICITTTVTSRE